MTLKALSGALVASALPLAAQASTTVQSEAPLSVGVLLTGTALAAVAAFVVWRKA